MEETLNIDSQNPEPEKDKGGEKSFVRTYRGDLMGAVKGNKISMVDMALAEDKKQTRAKTKLALPTSKKNLALLALSVFFIIIGIASFFLLKFLQPTPLIQVQSVNLEPLIYSEYQREIFLDKTTKLQLTKLIRTEIADTGIPLGSLIHFYLTTRNEGEAGKILLTTSELTQLMDSRVSDTFLRFVEPNFMFGFYSSYDYEPFLILKTSSYENTFPEMLVWEADLIEDLKTIFINDGNALLGLDRLRDAQYQFKDIVVNNKDARAVLDGGGKILFVYSFADEKTIVITTSSRALQEIFDRLTISYRTR